MKATVTARDELESVTAEETVRGYDEENRDTGAWLAALADATDCVYFEGRLQDADGGVIRVEFVEATTVLADLAEVLPGFEVVAAEPLVFSPIAALEAAVERGDVDVDEVEQGATVEIVDELRAEFRDEHGLSRDTDTAARIELRSV
ncbi:hypothetical protein ACOJIV_20315 [Haloarcula sp. AONF1]